MADNSPINFIFHLLVKALFYNHRIILNTYKPMKNYVFSAKRYEH